MACLSSVKGFGICSLVSLVKRAIFDFESSGVRASSVQFSPNSGVCLNIFANVIIFVFFVRYDWFSRYVNDTMIR